MKTILDPILGQIRKLDSQENFTIDYKNNGLVGTGNTTLTTLKQVADKVSSLDYIDIRDYAVDLTGVTDCTAKIATAISDAITTGKKKVYFPSGIYNGGMNNKNSNIEFIIGADVKVKQVWHFAVGSSPLIGNTSDPNYAVTDSYVENVKISGTITFIAPSGRLGCFMCKNCYVDDVIYTGQNYGTHIYFGTKNLHINSIQVKETATYSGITGSIFIDNIAGASDTYRPNNISISDVFIEYGYLSGIYLNADGCTINNLVVSNANNALVGDSHNIHIKKSNNICINYMSSHDCKGTNTYGLKIDQSTNIHVKGESYNNQRGCLITGNSDNVYLSLNSHDNASYGLQLGGSGYINILSASIKNNKGYGIFMTGITGKVIIENCIVDGTGVVATFQNGIYYTNSTGTVIIDKAELTNYKQTGGKGLYADTVTGKTIITNVLCHDNGEGFNINNNNCTGFLISNIQAYNNSVSDFTLLPADTLKGLGVP